MEQRLRTPLIPRPQWTTGLRLEQLLGPEVRVTAESFLLIRWNGGVLPTAIPVREPILPDDTAPRQFTVLLGDRPHRSGRHTHQLLVTLGALAAVRSAGGRSPLRSTAAGMCWGRQCRSWPSPAGSAEALLVDKAQLLTLTPPEMTVLVGGMRVLNTNFGQTRHGVFTSRPEALTNDYFVNLLDMCTEWKPISTDADVLEGRDRKTGEP